MDWKEYEEITKYIYETLGKANGIKIECCGNDCKLVGKSNVTHQIDVLTSHSDGLHSYKTIVECKYWDESINKDIIMKVAEIVEDTGVNKGVIVSKKGFTPDAISFAKYKNIGLVELREPTEDDWKGRVKNIQIEMNILSPQITGLQLILIEGAEPNIKAGKINTEYLEIRHSDGKLESIKKYVKKFNAELCNKKENEEIEKVFDFESGTKIIHKATGSETEIKGLKFNGFLRIAKQTIDIKGEDHILMIMKAIFENKTFTITKDGQINERKSNDR